MKLILSSCDFRNETSARVIYDNLPKPVGECRLLFIPNEKATSGKVKAGKYHARMTEFGFAWENVHVLDYDDPAASVGLDIDVLYISGGNTLHTLERIRRCGFDTEIIRYIREGVTYIGGSAGAHIVTKDVSHVTRYDAPPEGMTNFHGLGLFDGTLICHFTSARQAHVEELTQTGKIVYALTDEDSIVIQ